MSLYKEFIMKETHQLVVKVIVTLNDADLLCSKTNSIFIINS